MSELQEHTIRGAFDISGWESESYTVKGAGGELSRVTAVKEFVGEIEGSSVAELLMAGNDKGAGYVASEVFNGTVSGRRGSMIIQHWGLAEGTVAASSGHIIPGSGTDELADIAGKAEYSQDLSGQHHLELRVTFG
ncbi:DUF3224 family protein [Arthrobacter sp. JZ12]|uniref:DUF3224 domain-containing protein n=1 Tax=Arthrobacter sp. JZ12 TaxID=2654190 RepID=UPI002B467CC1|nr:DUF3224 domain-containing protein [Arthrobacter sp. JZ12]WRH25084.1 DUF3224 family protein [Arthrobacter sp. JZ12]